MWDKSSKCFSSQKKTTKVTDLSALPSQETSHTYNIAFPQSTELVEQKDSDTIDVSLEADGKENELDLTPVERAIIAEQLREDELAHTPDEGDPIREDLL